MYICIRYIRILYACIYIIYTYITYLFRSQIIKILQTKRNHSAVHIAKVQGLVREKSTHHRSGNLCGRFSGEPQGQWEFQDPKIWRWYVNVPFFRPYELWGYSLTMASDGVFFDPVAQKEMLNAVFPVFFCSIILLNYAFYMSKFLTFALKYDASTRLDIWSNSDHHPTYK